MRKKVYHEGNPKALGGLKALPVPAHIRPVGGGARRYGLIRRRNVDSSLELRFLVAWGISQNQGCVAVAGAFPRSISFVFVQFLAIYDKK